MGDLRRYEDHVVGGHVEHLVTDANAGFPTEDVLLVLDQIGVAGTESRIPPPDAIANLRIAKLGPSLSLMRTCR